MEKLHLPTMSSSSSSSNDDADLTNGGTATSSDEKIVEKPRTRKILQECFPERPGKNSARGEGPDTPPLGNSSTNHKRKATLNKDLSDVSRTTVREHDKAPCEVSVMAKQHVKSEMVRKLVRTKIRHEIFFCAQESFCRICARGGPFLKCHTCTAVYHKTCMYEVAWTRAAHGTWRCPNCLYMRGKDALRAA